MNEHESSRRTGQPRDRLIVGLAVATAVLAGITGSALAHADTNATTREFEKHISQYNATFKR